MGTTLSYFEFIIRYSEHNPVFLINSDAPESCLISKTAVLACQAT